MHHSMSLGQMFLNISSSGVTPGTIVQVAGEVVRNSFVELETDEISKFVSTGITCKALGLSLLALVLICYVEV